MSIYSFWIFIKNGRMMRNSQLTKISLVSLEERTKAFFSIFKIFQLYELNHYSPFMKLLLSALFSKWWQDPKDDLILLSGHILMNLLHDRFYFYLAKFYYSNAYKLSSSLKEFLAHFSDILKKNRIPLFQFLFFLKTYKYGV